MYYNSTDQNVPNYTSRGLNLLPYMVVLGTEPSLIVHENLVFLLFMTLTNNALSKHAIGKLTNLIIGHFL